MFEDLKKLVGLEAPNLETWTCDPLVVVDEGGEITWSKPAIVRYAPGVDRYEGGQGEVVDSESEEVVLRFTLEKVQHRDTYGLTAPFAAYVPWGENGVTAFVTDSEGHKATLYTATHADSYLAQIALGDEPADESATE